MTQASLQDWTYHGTYSGVPQGSIVAPILANVYLHELDLFMKGLKEQFDQGKRRAKYPAYHRQTERIRRLRKQADLLKGKEGKTEQLQEIQAEIRRVDRLRKRLPSVDPFDGGYRRLYSCRYADDYVIGIMVMYHQKSTPFDLFTTLPPCGCPSLAHQSRLSASLR